MAGVVVVAFSVALTSFLFYLLLISSESVEEEEDKRHTIDT